MSQKLDSVLLLRLPQDMRLAFQREAARRQYNGDVKATTASVLREWMRQAPWVKQARPLRQQPVDGEE